MDTISTTTSTTSIDNASTTASNTKCTTTSTTKTSTSSISKSSDKNTSKTTPLPRHHVEVAPPPDSLRPPLPPAGGDLCQPPARRPARTPRPRLLQVHQQVLLRHQQVQAEEAGGSSQTRAEADQPVQLSDIVHCSELHAWRYGAGHPVGRQSKQSLKQQ